MQNMKEIYLRVLQKMNIILNTHIGPQNENREAYNCTRVFIQLGKFNY